MTRRIALTGWFGSDNLGDELILRALCEAVQARGAEPVAVSIDADRTLRIHGIEAVSHRHPAHSPALARALRGCDGMVVAGGIVQAETSPWNIPFHASRLYAAAVARCPAAAVGIGVGRVDGRPSRMMARTALRRLRSVTVRDADSARRLRDWGLPEPAIGADPVAALAPPPVEPADTVCVILRPPNRPGWRTYSAKASGAVDSWQPGLDAAAEAVEAVASATGLKPRLTSFEAVHDDPLHRAAADRIGAPVEVAAPDLDTVLAEVGRSRLVITMRYHGAMAALLHGRPAVLLDYSPKMASLAAEGGNWAALVDPARLEADALVRAASEAMDGPDRTPEALAALRSRLAVNDAALDALFEARP